jgi:hypothetical protein
MSLEYSDDNELIYQAKAAAKNIVNAKYEVTKQVGDFLFLAQSEEEFYQRVNAIDPIIESTSTRRLASVSDSKAKLVKALFQEWEIKTAKEVSTQDEKDKEDAISEASEVQKKSKEEKEASAKGSSEINFSLPERVASPILPTEKTTQQVGPSRSGKLWDKWSLIAKKKDGSPGFVRRNPFEEKDERGNPKMSPEQRDVTKVGLTDHIIGNSLGRLDDPETLSKVTPGSAVWIDPHGLYGPDKKRTFDSIRGRKEQVNPDANEADASDLTAMVGRVPGVHSLGNAGIFLTHHRCTGNSFRGFNGNQTSSFPQCQHVHHEGDGCGLTSAVAEEGSLQPGCGKQHLVVTAQTPQLFNQPGNKETGEPAKLSPMPWMEDERPKSKSEINPSELQRQMNQAKSPEQAEALSYTNSTQEQVGEIPLDRAFLLHPDDAARYSAALDRYHTNHGGEGQHPANLDEFQIGDRTHRVGDIVSLQQGDAARHAGTENDLGIVTGASSHQNEQNVRFGKNHGRGANTDNDSSRVDARPGEYSLMVHRLNNPISGQLRPTAVDPDTNQISPTPVNETTQYYPSANVDTVEPFDAKKLGKGGSISKLYSRLKTVQASFKSKPTPSRDEKPKTMKPSRGNLDMSTLDLSDLFGDSDE